jgi:hypothetical protein
MTIRPAAYSLPPARMSQNQIEMNVWMTLAL